MSALLLLISFLFRFYHLINLLITPWYCRAPGIAAGASNPLCFVSPLKSWRPVVSFHQCGTSSLRTSYGARREDGRSWARSWSRGGGGGRPRWWGSGRPRMRWRASSATGLIKTCYIFIRPLLPDIFLEFVKKMYYYLGLLLSNFLIVLVKYYEQKSYPHEMFRNHIRGTGFCLRMSNNWGNLIPKVF